MRGLSICEKDRAFWRDWFMHPCCRMKKKKKRMKKKKSWHMQSKQMAPAWRTKVIIVYQWFLLVCVCMHFILFSFFSEHALNMCVLFCVVALQDSSNQHHVDLGCFCGDVCCPVVYSVVYSCTLYRLFLLLFGLFPNCSKSHPSLE